MAIFQPTNIVPSSFTEGTVDAVKDNMEVSWQVNGNSAMTAFQIDFYLNDTASTPVYSTGRKTDNCPFYGTDRFGRPQFFTWNAQKSWAQQTMLETNPITNGNNYKFKITQWYDGNDYIVRIVLTSALTKGVMYYFRLLTAPYTNTVVYFTTPVDVTNTATPIYANLTNNSGWIEETSGIILLPININPNGYIPSGAVTIPGGVNIGGRYPAILPQTSYVTFITRSKPTVTLYQTDSNYENAVLLPSTLATSIGYFQAKYEQVQSDPIRWVRWQIATATKTADNTYAVGDILVDTGDIYTPTLNFEFNGFFNNSSYALRCTGESESGQATELQGANANGWVFFDINYTESTYASSLTAQCLNKENATLLEWEGVSVISPTIAPADYSPNLNEGSVYLEPNSSVLWNKQFINQTESSLNFPTPYMAVYSGSLYQQTFNIDMVFQFTVQPNSTETQTQRIDSKYFILYVVYNDPTGVSQMSYSSNTVTITVRNNGTSVSSFVARPLVTYVEYMGGVVVKQQGSTNNLQISYNGSQNMFEVTVGTTSKYFASMTRDIEKYIFFVSNTQIELWCFNSNGERIYTRTVEFPEIGNITSLEILGGRIGAVFHSVSVYQGDGSNVLPLYQNADFEPVWNDDSYDLYMTANFSNNLEGGTGSTSGNGFVIYRREIGSNVLTPIANLSALQTQMKDYGIRSHKAYEYLLGVYDSNNAFMGLITAQNAIATCFKNYSLLVCDYDQNKDEYHVRKQYLFALNLNTGSVGNNNSPTLNANFTQYPTRMPSTQNYASGTLQGLIGAIYTVPALIEQIGNYKWTAKPSTLDYFDSVDLEKELYDLSTAPYQLFLRDMKGRLRMIATSGAISMTTNIKQRQQSISISFPWVEIGDASDVTIIQTPDDYGWNNDNQVLDVQLDVDMATGELSATYPFPHNGTKFYLTGVNKETLTAKTPLGVTPAQFNLSEVAEEPDDGEVTATVKVNGGGD